MAVHPCGGSGDHSFEPLGEPFVVRTTIRELPQQRTLIVTRRNSAVLLSSTLRVGMTGVGMTGVGMTGCAPFFGLPFIKCFQSQIQIQSQMQIQIQNSDIDPVF